MRALASAVVACAIALSLGSCSDEEPPPDEPTSAATTPANPDATLPPMPDVAQEDSHRGVSGFVRYYLLALNYGALTGNTSPLEELSSSDCTSCTSYIEMFRDTYRSGGYFKGGQWSYDDAEVRFSSVDRPAYVTADIVAAPGAQKLSSDEDESPTGKTKTLLTFELTTGSPRRIAEITKGGFE